MPKVAPPELRYTSNGVPELLSHATEATRLHENQKRFRGWAKCLKYLGYSFIIMGIANVAGNLIFMGAIDQFKYIPWADENGEWHNFEMDTSGLFVMALTKIITGIWMISQGKDTLSIFRPIL